MRFSSRSHRTALRPVAARLRRDGFTLAEVVISMVILSVGLLALASGSVGVMRQMRAGNKSAVAAMVAQSRLEKMRSKPCAAATGSATTNGMSERWRSYSGQSARYNAVAETVLYQRRAGKMDTLVMNGTVVCQ